MNGLFGTRLPTCRNKRMEHWASITSNSVPQWGAPHCGTELLVIEIYSCRAVAARCRLKSTLAGQWLPAAGGDGAWATRTGTGPTMQRQLSPRTSLRVSISSPQPRAASAGLS
jgi:hypothetical protein